MNPTFRQSHEKIVRYFLGSVLILLALNAFGGGYYGMAGAKDVPVEWLEGSPFSSYFFPGLFLFIVIGGSATTAAIAVFTRHRMACKAAYFCGTVTLLWIIVQVSIIGYVSWLQPAITVVGVLILLLSWLLSLKYNDKYLISLNK